MWLALVSICAVVALATTACSGPPALQHGVLEANAIVERVVDGDTLVITVGSTSERVRLIGIDTPESVDPRRPVECFGKEASQHLASLLSKGSSVRIEVDAEARDHYGRLLGYVYRAADGLFVNEAMVLDGYAKTLSIAPNVTHQQRFSAAMSAARDNNAGLWGACPPDG